MKTVKGILLKDMYQRLLKKGFDETYIQRHTGVSESDTFGQRRIMYSDYQRCLTLGYENNAYSLNVQHWIRSLTDVKGDFAPLINLCLNAPDARGALQSYLRYRAFIGEADQLYYQCHEDKVILTYVNDTVTPSASLQAAANFLLVQYLLSFYNPNDRVRSQLFLLGQPWPTQMQENDLGIQLHFGAATNQMIFSCRWLYRPSSVYNPYLNEYLQQRLVDDLLSARVTMHNDNGFSDEVFQLLSDIASQQGMAEVSADAIAHAMNISRWTLRRRLQADGCQYQDMIRDIRCQQASQLLRHSGRDIADISSWLGFSSQAAFSRFFRRHFGMSPSKYRHLTH